MNEKKEEKVHDEWYKAVSELMGKAFPNEKYKDIDAFQIVALMDPLKNPHREWDGRRSMLQILSQ